MSWRFGTIPLLSALVAFSGLAASEPKPGQPLPPWEPGELDIYQIDTGGSGDSAFFIFPDGTTLLLDAGALIKAVLPGYYAPPRPNNSLRPGQWIARYIRRWHPRGPEGELDYVMLTHFHGDHMGNVREARATEPGSTFHLNQTELPKSALGDWLLSGITDVGEEVPMRKVLDRGWPDYDFPRSMLTAKTPRVVNYHKFLEWHIEHRGMQVERFRPGRNDQIVLQHNPGKYPQFEVQNLTANGWVWTGSGDSVRNRFPAGQLPTENNCSLSFRLTYGAFTYYNGGDMTGSNSGAPEWTSLEHAVAWVTGPVDVCNLNHHGSRNSATDFFISALQPRVDILSNSCAVHAGPGVLRRLLSPQNYPGPRDIFMTTGLWEGRRENMVKIFGAAETDWALERIQKDLTAQGHILVRVDPGGATYRVIMIDSSREDGRVLSVHGPYRSRGSDLSSSASTRD